MAPRMARFPGRRKVILVHGCFWHRHACRKSRSTPATNKDKWKAKFERNVRRDKRVRRELRCLGWGVLVLWECQLGRWTAERIAKRVAKFLGRTGCL